MTKTEYAEYQQRFADFMQNEQLDNLSSGHIKCPNCNTEWDDTDHCPSCQEHRHCFDEPFFSWQDCECCGTSLGGDREHATGYNSTEKCIQEYTICTDCVYYAEYGELDDSTMMEMK